MTDKEFERKMKKCRAEWDKYKSTLEEIEAEYKKRFGSYPSELDDDWWIDTFHQGSGSVNLNEVVRSAEMCKSLKR